MLAPPWASRPSPFEIRRAISAASPGWFETSRRPSSLSHHRNAGMPSFVPWRIPAWLAEVWDGSSTSHRVSRWVPVRIQRDIVGTRPAWSCCFRTSWLSPSTWTITRPGTSVWIASERCMRRRRTRAPKCDSSSEIENTAVSSVFAIAKIHDPMNAAWTPSTSTPGTSGSSTRIATTWRTIAARTSSTVEIGANTARITGRTSRLNAQNATTARTPATGSRTRIPGTTAAIAPSEMNATTNDTATCRSRARRPGRQRTIRSIWIT